MYLSFIILSYLILSYLRKLHEVIGITVYFLINSKKIMIITFAIIKHNYHKKNDV